MFKVGDIVVYSGDLRATPKFWHRDGKPCVVVGTYGKKLLEIGREEKRPRYLNVRHFKLYEHYWEND